MLVSEIIERAYNEWLYPAGVNRPSYDKLTGGIDAATLTIPVFGRVKNIPGDSVIEIGQEQILLDTSAPTSLTAKERGWLETGAATHSSGDIVWIDPTFPRKTIFNALVTVMGLLYPAQIYARLVDTATTFSYTAPTKDLPAGGKKVLKIAVKSTGTVVRWNTLRPGIDYLEFLEFIPPKYELIRGGASGAVMQVVYKADFTKPTVETDDLSALAAPVPVDLQPHLPMAVAGHLLQGKEISRVHLEAIARALSTQGIQVGANLNVGQSLLNAFMTRYVGAERDRLKEMDAVGMEFSRR